MLYYQIAIQKEISQNLANLDNKKPFGKGYDVFGAMERMMLILSGLLIYS